MVESNLKIKNLLLQLSKINNDKEIIEFENIYEYLFPGQKLQERTENFFDYYVQIGNNFIPELIQNLDPLKKSFTILEF